MDWYKAKFLVQNPLDVRSSSTRHMLTLWQTRRDEATAGRWTHRLIGNVKDWVIRKQGEIDYHLTQALTEHFLEYLHLFGKLDFPSSFGTFSNDALRTVFQCDVWHAERFRLSCLLSRDFSPESMLCYHPRITGCTSPTSLTTS
ncbi:Hypothetical protein CINCED_3A024554 [Cinara cedri]|uniref:Uncharacterized protein n=1 Tax=Cinara cedri TaxID=506608 RepID=A0A5E4M667_9HEMI|nr:Hypothetical protein CINCED_3A024554 [Cinara cedri]